MEKLIISPTSTTPAIHLSVEENVYSISGTSRPEDVRELYYPVIEWIQKLAENILDGTINKYSAENALIFKTDLVYFNSSSAKFLYDIFMELKRIALSGVAVTVEWHYEKDDTDMLEAGIDIASLAEMEFTFIPKED
jgi:hypothetical protein